MPVENQVIILYAAINGYLDDIPVSKVTGFENSLIRTMSTVHPEIVKAIKSSRELSEATEESLKAAIGEFKQTFSVD
jgi:F-type H+-transporting ATPase subunit alpha